MVTPTKPHTARECTDASCHPSLEALSAARRARALSATGTSVYSELARDVELTAVPEDTYDELALSAATQALALITQNAPAQVADCIERTGPNLVTADLHPTMAFSAGVRRDSSGHPWVVIDMTAPLARLDVDPRVDPEGAEPDLRIVDELNQRARGYVIGVHEDDSMIVVSTHVATPFEAVGRDFAHLALRTGIEAHARSISDLRAFQDRRAVPVSRSEEIQDALESPAGWTLDDLAVSLAAYGKLTECRGVGDLVSFEKRDNGVDVIFPIPSTSTDALGRLHLEVGEDGSIHVDVHISRGMKRRRAQRMVRRLNQRACVGHRTHPVVPWTLGAWHVDGLRHGKYVIVFRGRISPLMRHQGSLSDHIEGLVRMTLDHWESVRLDYKFAGVTWPLTR